MYTIEITCKDGGTQTYEEIISYQEDKDYWILEMKKYPEEQEDLIRAYVYSSEIKLINIFKIKETKESPYDTFNKEQ